MELKTTTKQNVKIKLGLQGPAGSGKTYSSLLLAYGMTYNWSMIGIIDAENHSADLYAHLGNYQVLVLDQPFNPERYIEAIDICERAGMEVIIIDSISSCWEGPGGILDIHGGMVGNSFTNWSKLTPRYNAFVQKILQSKCHIIANIRSKQDYVLSEKMGKMVPEKVGLKGVTREGMDYEFTIVLELDIRHQATASKDRTNLFMDKPSFLITPETGQKIAAWCNSGVSRTSKEVVCEMIKSSSTIERLNELYKSYPEFIQQLNPDFTKRKQEIISENIRNNQNFGKNGTQISPV